MESLFLGLDPRMGLVGMWVGELGAWGFPLACQD